MEDTFNDQTNKQNTHLSMILYFCNIQELLRQRHKHLKTRMDLQNYSKNRTPLNVGLSCAIVLVNDCFHLSVFSAFSECENLFIQFFLLVSY